MEKNNFNQTAICVPLYNNQIKLEINYIFKTKKCCYKTQVFELCNKNNEWELKLDHKTKYYFIVTNINQFNTILINLGIKNNNYLIDMMDLSKNKKINFYKSNDLEDALKWCLNNDNDMKSVRCLY
jgi:hypothetical protein